MSGPSENTKEKPMNTRRDISFEDWRELNPMAEREAEDALVEENGVSDENREEWLEDNFMAVRIRTEAMWEDATNET